MLPLLPACFVAVFLCVRLRELFQAVLELVGIEERSQGVGVLLLLVVIEVVLILLAGVALRWLVRWWLRTAR